MEARSFPIRGSYRAAVQRVQIPNLRLHASFAGLTFLFLCGLNQRGKHHTEAQEIADVGEVYVEIPADELDVVEDSETCDTANKSQRAVDGLKNQLGSSVFNHNDPPYSLPGCRAAWRFTILDVSR